MKRKIKRVIALGTILFVGAGVVQPIQPIQAYANSSYTIKVGKSRSVYINVNVKYLSYTISNKKVAKVKLKKAKKNGTTITTIGKKKGTAVVKVKVGKTLQLKIKLKVINNSTAKASPSPVATPTTAGQVQQGTTGQTQQTSAPVIQTPSGQAPGTATQIPTSQAPTPATRIPAPVSATPSSRTPVPTDPAEPTDEPVPTDPAEPTDEPMPTDPAEPTDEPMPTDPAVEEVKAELYLSEDGKKVEGIYNKNEATYVEIPNSVTSIGDWVFSDCTSLERVTIPNSVTSIGKYAFCGCTSLQSVTILDSVKSIEKSAFWGCTVLEVTVPDTVETVGSNSFQNVKNVKYQGTLKDAPWGAKALNGEKIEDNEE